MMWEDTSSLTRRMIQIVWLCRIVGMVVLTTQATFRLILVIPEVTLTYQYLGLFDTWSHVSYWHRPAA